MKISVIIAAYKGERFIEEQLQSLFRQTLLPDEILIGDDSPDLLTGEAVERCRKNLPPSISLRYIRNQEQLGFLKNFLHLAELAEGEYIFFCDQDDVWLPEKIARLADMLDKNPSCDLAFSDSYKVTGDLSKIIPSPELPCHFDILSNKKFCEEKINKGEAFSIFQEYINRDFIAGHNMALRKSALELLLAIPEEYTFHDMWCGRIFPFLERCRCTMDCLVLHRMHDSNASARKLFHKKFFFIPRRVWEVVTCGPEDLHKVTRLYRKLRNCAILHAGKNHIPEKNLLLLRKHLAFTFWRIHLHKTFFLCRWGAILRKKKLYKEYYQGTRFPLLRDLFSLN